MKLKIKRPIIVFDLETTGINVASDKIVEISLIKIHPNQQEERKTYRVNPEIPIPEEVIAIHGITNEDVKDKPVFKEIAKPLAKFFEGSDIAGFNCNKFDVPLLVEEFLRVGVEFDIQRHKVVDVQVIFHKMEKRTLGAAYKFYCKKDLINAHSAEADTDATFEVLKAQLEMYDGQNYVDNRGNEQEVDWTDVEDLSKFSAQAKHVDFAGRIVFNDKGEETFNFGKHKGKRVIDVLEKEPSYYNWMMNGDFPLFTKKILTNIKIKMFQQ
jgi:DNA polymerase III subunit epsilon